MKLRIAAVLAVVLFVGAIAAYWWDFREHPGAGNSEAAASPENGNVMQEGVPRSQTGIAAPPLEARDRTSVAAVTPAAVAKSGSSAGSVLPPPIPSPKKPPRADVPSASPPTPVTPEKPPEPEVSAKAAIEVGKVGLMLRDYRTRMGENPTGTNAEIMKAVMGGNPKKAMLGPPEGQQINGNGELVDRWGTPYFFHQMSKTDMEIRSAGPDQQLWTADDIVGR